MNLRLNRKQKVTVEESEMTLVAHLRELRTRLIRSALSIAVGALVVYIFNEQIFNFLAAPYCDLQTATDEECEFLIRGPLESFQVVLSIAGYGGLILALPVIFYQLGKFVLPGLYPNEKRMLVPFVAVSVLLLALGIGGGYLIMPKTLEVLGGFGPESFQEMFSPRDYISFFIKMLLAFGLAAQLPMVLVFLQLVGVLEPATLRKNRRIAVVAVVILAAVISPTGDPFTLLVLAGPMYVFYELAILVGSRLTRSRRAVLEV